MTPEDIGHLYESIWAAEAASCPDNHKNHDAEQSDGVVVMQCRDCGRVVMCSPQHYREFFEVTPDV